MHVDVDVDVDAVVYVKTLVFLRRLGDDLLIELVTCQRGTRMQNFRART